MESLNQLISVPTWLLLSLGLGGLISGILLSILTAWATAVINPPAARKKEKVATSPKTEQRIEQPTPAEQPVHAEQPTPKPVSFVAGTKRQPPARASKVVTAPQESKPDTEVHLTKEQSQQLQDKLKNRKMYSSVEIATILRTTPEQAVSWIVDMKVKGYKTFYSNHGQRYIEAKAVADQFGG